MNQLNQLNQPNPKIGLTSTIVVARSLDFISYKLYGFINQTDHETHLY